MTTRGGEKKHIPKNQRRSHTIDNTHHQCIEKIAGRKIEQAAIHNEIATFTSAVWCVSFTTIEVVLKKIISKRQILVKFDHGKQSSNSIASIRHWILPREHLQCSVLSPGSQ